MLQFFEKLYDASRLYWLEKRQSTFKNYQDYVDKHVEEFIKNDSDELKKIKRAMIRRSIKRFHFEIGCDSLIEVPVEQYGSYIRFDDDEYEFPGGYSKLINFLAEKIPSSIIRLNHAVESIKVNNDSTLIIKCKNNTQFNSKHVIVTCSLGYLKQHYKTLLPQNLLTESKINALNRSQMGYVTKFLFIYDDLLSFYPENIDSLFILRLDDDIESENYDYKTKWFYKIGKFDRFLPNVLRVLITGKEALYSETLSNDEIIRIATDILQKALKNNKIPLPKELIK